MGDPVLLIVLLGFWLLAAVGLWTANPFGDDYKIIWWPIELVKYLLKTLWQVLFTGWRT